MGTNDGGNESVMSSMLFQRKEKSQELGWLTFHFTRCHLFTIHVKNASLDKRV